MENNSSVNNFEAPLRTTSLAALSITPTFSYIELYSSPSIHHVVKELEQPIMGKGMVSGSYATQGKDGQLSPPHETVPHQDRDERLKKSPSCIG